MTQQELVKLLTPDPYKAWAAVSAEKKPDKFTYAIQKFQGTHYSHALWIYYSQDFRDFVVANAHGQASQLDTLDQFHKIDQVEHLFEKKLTVSERLNFIRAVVELDGIDYSEMQIFNIGLQAIFGVIPEGNGVDGVICSEYAERLGIAAGLQACSGVVGKDTEILTPKDNIIAWEFMAKHRKDFKKIS